MAGRDKDGLVPSRYCTPVSGAVTKTGSGSFVSVAAGEALGATGGAAALEVQPAKSSGIKNKGVSLFAIRIGQF
jgi:hypothetical protein